VTVRPRLVRFLRWALALGALAFVVWVVPVRDQCWDARSPRSTHVAVTHVVAGCTLHLRTGEVTIPEAECSQLRCEPGLATTVEHARVGALAALLAVYLLGMFVWAARWRALLAFAGIEMSILEVWRVSIEAQAGGILLPGGIGGDALRIASVASRPTRAGETRAPVAIVVASVLLDRVVGLAVLSALAAALGFGWGGLRDATLAFVLAAIPVGAFAGIALLRLGPVERIRWLTRGRVGEVVGPVLQYVRDPRAPGAIARAVALSVLVAAIQFATIRGIIGALGSAPSSEKWVYVGSAMSFIVAAVPALPGGWGTSDASWVFFLGKAGLAAGAALAVCLMYRLFWYFSGMLGALLHLFRPRTAAVPAAADPAGQPPS
jgi:hypothetical protein